MVAGDGVYLIDCGDGVAAQYRRAGLGPAGSGHGLDHLRAIFLTHLHSDHTIGYPGLLIAGVLNGLSKVAQPIQVYGPGRQEPAAVLSGDRGSGRVVNPQDPVPGVVELTHGIFAAFATDLNERLRSPHVVNPESVFEPHEITLPAEARSDPSRDPAPRTEPFLLYEDPNVRVTATLVDHRPCFPAFGFRFETADGVIVFSGDTRPNENLVRMARGADILVHEVISKPAMERHLSEPAARARLDGILRTHTTVEEVDAVARAAGVGKLVLSHVVPPNAAADEFRPARPEFDGEVIVGEDLDQITLSAGHDRKR